MTGQRFAALRRRVQRDADLRARLRASFDGALPRERPDDALTPEQAEELRLVLLLHAAFHGAPEQTASRPRLRALPPARVPIDLAAWRTRRAAGAR